VAKGNSRCLTGREESPIKQSKDTIQQHLLQRLRVAASRRRHTRVARRARVLAGAAQPTAADRVLLVERNRDAVDVRGGAGQALVGRGRREEVDGQRGHLGERPPAAGGCDGQGVPEAVALDARHLCVRVACVLGHLM